MLPYLCMNYLVGFCIQRSLIIYLTKPLPTLLIGLQHPEHLLQLFLYAFGDLLLMPSIGEDFWLTMGILSFMVGHWIRFRKLGGNSDLLLFLAMISGLFDHSLIIFYFGLLLACVYLSRGRYMVIGGWILFIISDAIIAIQLFSPILDKSLGCIYIMVAYWFACYLLAI